jgi:glycine oxidase
VKSADIIIAGAGIIGVSIALELRERGASVLVLDRGVAGQESSSAAAGMLAPADPETPAALRSMALESARMFPEYVRKIESLSGITTDFRRHGTIAFLNAGATVPAEYSRLSAADLHRLEPHLQSPDQSHDQSEDQSEDLSAFLIREDTVDPRLLMQAALAAARQLGVKFRENTEVKEIRCGENEVEVLTTCGEFTSHTAINCRGAWAGAPVRPRKGQMLYLQPAQSDLLQHVVHAPDAYIVPRSSGKILVGATVEDVGFDKSVIPSTIDGLLRTAARYLPELASAPIVDSWAGLRPGTPDNLPILGLSGKPGIYVAGGHFRNGILLAPITAKIIASLVTGKDLGIDITSFAPSRFAPAKT